MALFNFVYSNHGHAPIHMEDYAAFLECAFVETGYDFHISPTLNMSAVNIMVEYFADEKTAGQLINYAKMGLRLALIFTDAIIDKPLPNDTQRNERIKRFLKVAEACKTVWCFSKEQIEGCKKLLPASYFHVMPYGYVDGFATVETLPDRLKDVDFSFVGQTNARREHIINKLRSMGFNVVSLNQIPPDYIRGNLVGRTKVSLGLKPFDDWDFPAVPRDYYHLMNGAYIIAEKCKPHSITDGYIGSADSDKFIAACIDTYGNPHLSSLAMQNLERFRNEVPLKPLFSKFLEQSLGSRQI